MSLPAEGLSSEQRIGRVLGAGAQRPSHSYLFTGPGGQSKSKTARRFAAAVVCPVLAEGDRADVEILAPAPGSKENAEHYDGCPSCSRALRGLHPDVQIFQPEGYTFPVELIREIVASAAQTPMEASRRVFILEEAHRITERSQNALLKALEEPSPTVTWLLITDAIEPLLPTILSRCQVIEFPTVADDRSEPSSDTASQELEWRVRDLAYRAATGTDLSAVGALDIAEEAKGLAAQARQAAQVLHKGELDEFEQTMGTGRGAGAAKKRISDRHKRILRRLETDVFLDFAYWLGCACRDLAAVGSGAAADSLIAPDFAARVLEAASERPVRFWMDMVEACVDGQLAIQENANPTLVAESIVLRLAWPRSPASTI